MTQRRTLLQATAPIGAVTVFSVLVPGIRALAQQPPRVRRSVNTMALDDPDLSTYRDFVGLMRARPATQRLSWVGFANQHGDANDFKYCPHGDWYFLPWHRGFVEMYERAAAVLTSNPKFAMPYWDWTALRTLPAAFTDPTYKGQPNPLYVPGRGDDPSIQRNALSGPYALTDALVGPDVMRRIYQETVFEAFGTSRNPKQTNLDPKWVPAGGGNQGILERTPHNNVHNNIGGYMPNSNSPRDPIFMMHHGNIDRIWASWNALGRRNSTDPLWLNMPFAKNYISPTGQFYGKVVKDLLSISALGYTYDVMPPPDNKPVDQVRAENLAALFNPAAKARPSRFKKANILAARAAAPLSVPISVESAALKSAVAAAGTPAPAREVVAIISDIQVADNVQAIRVFVNHPMVSQDVSETDPHFVTTLSFLKHGKGGDHSAHKSLPSTVVDLTETLRRLAGTAGLASDTVTVQLVAVPFPGAAPGTASSVVPAAVEIAIV